LSEQAINMFSGLIFGSGHFGLAILLRPSHESLLLRVAELNGVIKSCEGFGALIRCTVSTYKIGGILRDMAGEIQMLCGIKE